MNTTGLAQALMEAMAAGPWWAWPVSLVTTLLTLAAAVWLARRALSGVASTVREAVTAAALGERERREKIAAFLRAQAMTLLFVAVVGIVVGLSAQTMVAWLMEIGMSRLWARLGFVAFDGMAMMLALTLWQRLRRDEATGMIRPALWGIVAASSFFCSQHAPEGNAPAAVAYALFPVIAALGLEFLLQEQRRDRTWLKEQAGEQERRRLALVRWLHPVERVQVHLEMARDEALGAEEATRLVRERTASRAVWRLKRYQGAGRVRRVLFFRPEQRAQAALDAVGVAADGAAMAAVLRRVQVLTLAEAFARLDYSTPSAARRVFGQMITEEALVPRALPPASADRSGPVEDAPGPDRYEGGEAQRTGRDGGPAADPAEPEQADRTGPIEHPAAGPADDPDRSEQEASLYPDRWDRSDAFEPIDPPAWIETDPTWEQMLATWGTLPAAGDPQTGPPSAEESGPVAEPEPAGPHLGPDRDTEPPAQKERSDSEERSDRGPMPVDPVRTGPQGAGPDRPGTAKVDRTEGNRFRTVGELRTEMREAVRTGDLDRNTVDAIVKALRCNKRRARELRAWAHDVALFGQGSGRGQRKRKKGGQ